MSLKTRASGGSAPGKQNLKVTCPTGKVEFKYFSSPGWYTFLILANFNLFEFSTAILEKGLLTPVYLIYAMSDRM